MKHLPTPPIVVTLDGIEIVQVDLFCGVVDIHLAYCDDTQDIPADITADTLPELVSKLDAAGFDMDVTLMNLAQVQDSERVPNDSNRDYAKARLELAQKMLNWHSTGTPAAQFYGEVIELWRGRLADTNGSAE